MKSIKENIKSFCLLIGILIPLNLSAQNFGYFGKKNYLDVDYVAHSPIVANTFESWENGTGLFGPRLYNHLVSGISLNYAHSFRQNSSFGLEFTYKFQSYFNSTLPAKVGLSTFHIMPKFEFTKAQHVLPLGISHQFGIGYFQIITTYSKDKSTHGIGLMYAIIARKTITKSLFFNYGARYTLNVPLLPTYGSISSFDYQTAFNFVSLEVGMTYAF